MKRRSFLGAGLGVAATLAAGGAFAVFPFPQMANCRAFCFLDPDSWILDLGDLPVGSVLIGGYNGNRPVSTTNRTAIGLALGRGVLAPWTPQQELNAHFVAAQLSLIRAGASIIGPAAFRSALQCYGFTSAVSLSNGLVVSGLTTLRFLWDASAAAVTTLPANDVDCLTLADIFRLIERTCLINR